MRGELHMENYRFFFERLSGEPTRQKLLLIKLEHNKTQKNTRNYTGVQKISKEDPRENLKNAIKSSILLSSSSSSDAGLQLRLRGTCHLETKHM
jgi:hypothetical protein